ncbi:inosine-uridine preferring nucleoside hydrolase [Pseudomassariella vexata]|uniref:Inosine-uridine preferring nucleoside hydrolase n=1 Tax=Pseudomassariella vexata TaxID=1141098 RepID=A0A1Y2DE56_9PEZI|nr:inosine-uridine preferring nucleoside hydrolase [Pseudomassariella vexata]ORY57550.1 inosine-uridine preferring nucleoside hydrolase [Pseudomassariella vexata]
MAPRNRIIFDTDPAGVDDMLAMLLALASSPEELEIVMLSVTYGNVPLKSCLKNVVSLFHVLDKEIAWRRAQGKPQGFEVLRAFKPIVAIGPEHALEEEILAEDGFHGADGLHGVHEAHPHLSPAETWKSLFEEGVPSAAEDPSYYSHFIPSRTPAHKEILRILKEEPEDTITICAVGPMTNIAMAAAEDPETFLRVKELVVMGGAVDVEGNVTPVAEFNTFADAIATARVFALTSAVPTSTMPTVPLTKSGLPPYPEKLSKRLRLSLFPLDITTPHLLNKSFFFDSITTHLKEGSPLATWINTFMSGTFRQIERIVGTDEEPGLSLHDPLTIWYMITHGDPGWKLAKGGQEDIRVETSGQWTHGMHVIDRRGRKRAGEGIAVGLGVDSQGPDAVTIDEITGDDFGWLSAKRGNRINRYAESPGTDKFAPLLMERLFGKN